MAPTAAADRILFISTRDSGEVWVMNEDGTGKMPVTDRDPSAGAPDWSSDGSRIAFQGLSNDGVVRLWIMSPDGSISRGLRFSARLGWDRDSDLWFEPDWSPNGRRLVFTMGNTLHVVNRDGRALRRLRHAVWAFNPAWSPSGGWIAFESIDGLALIRVDGSGRREIGSGLTPDWSPSGRRLVVVDWTPGGRGELYSIRSDGSDRRRLTRTPHDERQPAWSPGGGKIAYVRGASIWVMSPNGSGARRVIADGYSPSWAPSGRRLVFSRSDALYTVRLDGSGLRRIVTPEADEDVSASPDGTRIAYRSSRPFGQDGVYVADSDGGDELFLHDGYSPHWSPDGSRILLENEGVPVIVDPDGTDPAPLPEPDAYEARDWRWHPDGRVSFVGWVGDCSDVYVMNLDGTGIGRVTPDSCLLDSLYAYDWFPSAGGVVLEAELCDGFCDQAIFAMSLPGGGVTTLSDGAYADYAPSVSPAGTRVAFTRRQPEAPESTIWSIGLDAGNELQLTTGMFESNPAWLPDTP